jgi:hypothetical protein
MYYVIWYEGDIRQENGGFDTFGAAESWMNNNLDNTIKHAGIEWRD